MVRFYEQHCLVLDIFCLPSWKESKLSPSREAGRSGSWEEHRKFVRRLLVGSNPIVAFPTNLTNNVLSWLVQAYILILKFWNNLGLFVLHFWHKHVSFVRTKNALKTLYLFDIFCCEFIWSKCFLIENFGVHNVAYIQAFSPLYYKNFIKVLYSKVLCDTFKYINLYTFFRL